MDELKIRLLGQMEITQANALSQLQLTGACQKLLAYLLINPGKMCRREMLMDVFWRHSDRERARHSLNSTLWRLRRELEPYESKGANYLLTTDSGEIGFNWACDYWLDVQLFEQRISPALRKPISAVAADEAIQVECTLALYRGELLEGIYDDWTLSERERLRLLHLEALAQLMNYYAHGGAFEKSMEFARTILSEDPLREDVHRHLMQLYVSAGQRALAVQQYRTCAAILESELGIPPMEETQQLYRQILDPSATPPASVADTAPVHPETERHLRSVVRNLEQAHTHLKQAVHVMARLMHINVDT